LFYSVEIAGKSIEIVERFGGFLPVDDSSGNGLANVFLYRLEEFGLSIHNCCVQGYDNRANMRGGDKGV
jgi:hypothetical protein